MLSDDGCRKVLSQALFSGPATLLDVKRAIRLISHGLTLPNSRDQLCHSLLFLLARIVADAARLLSRADLDILKEELFVRESNIKTLCVTQHASDTIKDGNCLVTFLIMSELRSV